MACCNCKDPGYQNVNRWVIFALSFITWIFAIVAVSHCSFFKIDSNEYVVTNSELGLFKFQADSGVCEKYGNDGIFTTSHKVARAFGALSAAVTGLAFVGTALIIFFLKGKSAVVIWIITKVLLALSILTTLVTFAFIGDCVDLIDDYLDDDFYCTLGAAGYLASANVFILLGISITSCCTPVPPKPLIKLCGTSSSNDESYAKEKTSQQPQDVEAIPVSATHGANSSVVKRTIEVTPQGKKITEEVVQPDGSRVVTETLETNAGE